MSVGSRSPLRVLGSIPVVSGSVASGFANTSEIRVTDGGEIVACVWSGNLLTNASLTGCPAGSVTSGGHIQLWSGAGRLNKIMPHAMLTSGQPVTFYDAGTITASGVSVSGQKFIGRIPARAPATLALASGEVDRQMRWEDVITVNMPFASGLCVGAASGAPGFTVSFTPSLDVAFP